MKNVVFYDKETKGIMGTGSYSNPDDVPKQYPHVEVEELMLADPNSILEVYEDAGKEKVRITGTRPVPPSIEETLAIIVADVKTIKENLKIK